jgi:hypothetical protein
MLNPNKQGSRGEYMAVDPKDRIRLLMEGAKKFLEAMHLDQALIQKIYRADTDWEFIIKIDALLEAAVKSMVKERFNLGTDEEARDSLDGFAEALPMNGRTSLLAVLKADGCPKETWTTIEAVRRLRNGFAHDIRLTDARLIDIIKQRPDKRQLIRDLCQIRAYHEAELIKDYESDGSFLRFAILDTTLRILIMAYPTSHPEP